MSPAAVCGVLIVVAVLSLTAYAVHKGEKVLLGLAAVIAATGGLVTAMLQLYT